MDIKRTQIWFNKIRLDRKNYTGKSWQYLVDLGIEYQEYLISIQDQIPSEDFKKPKGFLEPLTEK